MLYLIKNNGIVWVILYRLYRAVTEAILRVEKNRFWAECKKTAKKREKGLMARVEFEKILEKYPFYVKSYYQDR